MQKIIIIFIIGAVIGGAGVYFFHKEKPLLSPQAAAEKAINSINQQIEEDVTASLLEVTEESGVYKIHLKIAEREYESYITKDGKILFSFGIDVEEQPEPAVTEEEKSESVQLSIGQSPVLGRLDAPITVFEFSEVECPFCGAAEGVDTPVAQRLKQENSDWEPIYPNLIKEYVDTGKVKLVYKHFPLNMHPHAMPAALAASCAHEQNKFWEYHDILYQNWEDLSLSNFKKWAKDLKLDAAKFNVCLETEKYKEEIQKNIKEGENVNVTGVPAYFINGKLLSGAQPYSDLKQLIEQQLASL